MLSVCFWSLIHFQFAWNCKLNIASLLNTNCFAFLVLVCTVDRTANARACPLPGFGLETCESCFILSGSRVPLWRFLCCRNHWLTCRKTPPQILFPCQVWLPGVMDKAWATFVWQYYQWRLRVLCFWLSTSWTDLLLDLWWWRTIIWDSFGLVF